MSRVTAYQPSKDAKTITEFHPAFNDMLDMPPKKVKGHVRSRSAEPNLLQEIQQEENFNRSKSFYLKQHSRRSDYSSLNAPPSLGESIDRRIGSQSSVVSHGAVFGMDSGYSGGKISAVAPDDFQPGCFPKLPNRKIISSYWTSNNKRQLDRELPGHEPLCHFSIKLNREANDCCKDHESQMQRIEQFDSDLANRQQILETEGARAVALEEYLKNEAKKKQQKGTLRRRSTPSSSTNATGSFVDTKRTQF